MISVFFFIRLFLFSRFYFFIIFFINFYLSYSFWGHNFHSLGDSLMSVDDFSAVHLLCWNTLKLCSYKKILNSCETGNDFILETYLYLQYQLLKFNNSSMTFLHSRNLTQHLFKITVNFPKKFSFPKYLIQI